MNNTTTPNLLCAANSGSTSSNPFVDAFEGRDPTVNDINYPIQKKWLNTSNGNYWVLATFTSFQGLLQATWLQIGNTVTTVESLTGNDAIVVEPNAGNNINVVGDGTYIKVLGNAGTSTETIQPAGGLALTYVANTGSASASSGSLSVLGSQGISTIASGDTLNSVGQPAIAAASSSLSNLGVASFKNTDFLVDGNGFVSFADTAPYYSLTPFIVGTDVHSQYSTIQAAITDATAPANIYIKPKSGNYVEDLVMKPGVILNGSTGAIIQGKMTFPTAGIYEVDGITLETNNDYCISVTGSNAITAFFYNSTITALNHSAIQQSNSNASTNIQIEDTDLFISTTGISLYDHSGTGFITFFNCNALNPGASTVASINSSGIVAAFYTFFGIATNTSSTGNLAAKHSSWDTSALNITPITSAGSGLLTLVLSDAASGTASSVSAGTGTTISLYNCCFFSTNTHTVTGAGTVNYSGLSIPSGDINTSTVNKLNFYAGNVL